MGTALAKRGARVGREKCLHIHTDSLQSDRLVETKRLCWNAASGTAAGQWPADYRHECRPGVPGEGCRGVNPMHGMCPVQKA